VSLVVLSEARDKVIVVKLKKSCVQRERTHAVSAISMQKHVLANRTWL